MSDVVIRCPHCGTTQQAVGECEACHEADARYFCPNHVPGRWIDGPQCGECGARWTGRSPAAAPPPPPPRRATAPPSRGARGAPPPVRHTPPPPPPVRDPRAELEDLLEDLAGRSERRPRLTHPDEEVGWPGTPPRPTLPPLPGLRVGVGSVFGCMGKLVMLVVVMLAAAFLGFFGYCGVY